MWINCFWHGCILRPILPRVKLTRKFVYFQNKKFRPEISTYTASAWATTTPASLALVDYFGERACLSVCLPVCPRAYLQDCMSDLRRIFLHVTHVPGSVHHFKNLFSVVKRAMLVYKWRNLWRLWMTSALATCWHVDSVAASGVNASWCADSAPAASCWLRCVQEDGGRTPRLDECIV